MLKQIKKESVKKSPIRLILVFVLILVIIFAILSSFFVYKTYIAKNSNNSSDVSGKVTASINLEREPAIVKWWKGLFGK